MTEGRLARLSAEEARARLVPGMPERYAEVSAFRIALKDPPVAEAMAGLLGALLQRGCLDPRLRELAIMRIGWSTGSVYVYSSVLRTLAVPLEDGVAPWPPDGVAPAPSAST